MPQPIIMPQKRNPWEEMLPYLIQASAAKFIEQKYAQKALEGQRQYNELQYAQKAMEEGRLRPHEPTPETAGGLPEARMPGMEKYLEPAEPGKFEIPEKAPETVTYGEKEYEVVPPTERINVIDIPGMKGRKGLLYGDKLQVVKADKAATWKENVIVKPGSPRHKQGLPPGVWQQEKDDEGKTTGYTLTDKFDFDLFEGKDPKTGKMKQTYVIKGDPVPEGFTKAKGAAPSATATILTEKAKSKLLEGILNPTTTIAQYKDMMKGFDPNYFRYLGKGAAWTQEVGAKLGIGKAEFASRQKAYMQEIDQAFNKYRKEITGAQASMQEINFLKSTIPSSDDAPPIFEAKAKRFIIGLARLRKRNSMLLDRGMKLRSHKVDEEGNIISDATIDAIYGDMPIENIDLNENELTNLFSDTNLFQDEEGNFSYDLLTQDKVIQEAFGGRERMPGAAEEAVPGYTGPVTNADEFLKKYQIRR